jgi:uncharacterized membrane protein YfcA
MEGQMMLSRTLKVLKVFITIMVFLSLILGAANAFASTDAAVPPESGSQVPWWVWPITLFVVTFVLGILAVLGGMGGGTLYVPIISGFFPFHLDFVRCTGLLVALTGALAAGPGLLRRNLASLRLTLPVALIASSAAIVGALIGLALPTNIIQTGLGAVILFIVFVMASAKNSDFPDVPKPDNLSQAFGMNGIYREESLDRDVEWRIHRTPAGLALFIIIGIMAGMFGIGAGWANIPVLNLMMGAPLKVSVATSKFLLSITDTSAAWIFINKGAVLPMMVVPSIIGIMLGSMVGVRILAKTKPKSIKWIVIVLLLFAGLRALLKGLGIWT